MDKRTLGNHGEDLAAKFLQQKEYQILHRQYQNSFGEIDIIAQKETYIVFIEVKYRRQIKYGYPRESVGSKKQRRIKKCALFFIAKNKLVQQDFRFDVIEIIDHSDLSIIHIENAFC